MKSNSSSASSKLCAFEKKNKITGASYIKTSFIAERDLGFEVLDLIRMRGVKHFSKIRINSHQTMVVFSKEPLEKDTINQWKKLFRAWVMAG